MSTAGGRATQETRHDGAVESAVRWCSTAPGHARFAGDIEHSGPRGNSSEISVAAFRTINRSVTSRREEIVRSPGGSCRTWLIVPSTTIMTLVLLTALSAGLPARSAEWAHASAGRRRAARWASTSGVHFSQFRPNIRANAARRRPLRPGHTSTTADRALQLPVRRRDDHPAPPGGWHTDSSRRGRFVRVTDLRYPPARRFHRITTSTADTGEYETDGRMTTVRAFRRYSPDVDFAGLLRSFRFAGDEPLCCWRRH